MVNCRMEMSDCISGFDGDIEADKPGEAGAPLFL